MEDLFRKLQSLKGETLDDATIAQLIAAANGTQSLPPVKEEEPFDWNGIAPNSNEHVDDLLIASRAAELELASMRRYFQTPNAVKVGGIDGLEDEDLSSDTDDDTVLKECVIAEKSALDKLLSKNSLVSVQDDEVDSAPGSNDGLQIDLSHVPSTVVVPYGAQFIPLGQVQSTVDGLLVIGATNVMETEASGKHRNGVACDVESMVFLEGSEPLEVLGMIVDTLGTVANPLHLVLVSNKSLVARLESENGLVGAKVCTLTSHSKVIEVDEFAGQLAIRGCPQLAELEDCDDDGSDNDEQPVPQPPAPRHQPPPPPNPYYVNNQYSYRR
jgi:hypothetical protein